MPSLTVHHRIWRQVPWLLGLLAAPLLMGGVTVESQVISGLLIALGIFLNVTDLPIRTTSPRARTAMFILLGFLLFPLVPLPPGVVEMLSPERARLARDFAIPGMENVWTPLTLSPARTVHRIWELLLVFAVYWLSKQASRNPAFPRALAITIGVTVGLLAFSDVLLRVFGKNIFLGTGQTGWGTPAGTFANRNHFAAWIYVGSLFSFGWILRNTLPIQRARPTPVTDLHLRPGDIPGLSLAIVFGLVMGVLSGSRGGFITFVGGCFVWLALMTHRGRSRLRFQLMAGFICLLLFVAWAAGDNLFFRMSDVLQDLLYRYPKVAIWKDAWGMVGVHPVFGVGAGSFVWAFNHYKSAFGGTTFWHAENDYLQTVIELGIPASIILFLGLFRGARSTLALVLPTDSKLREPELIIGAIAALSTFVMHAMFEFVFQIESIALLAAAILGFLRGMLIWQYTETGTEILPRTPFRRGPLALGVVIIATAVVMATATAMWHVGLKQYSSFHAITNLTRSLKLWPFAADRQIALSRLQVAALEGPQKLMETPAPEEIRDSFHRALRVDPMNWGLRLEGAWVELAFAEDRELALAEAEKVVRLNRLQPQIPLRFARYFAYIDQSIALGFLRRVPHDIPRYFEDSLEIVWDMTSSATDLWEMTPDEPENLLILGQFAIQHNLAPMAASAFRLLEGRRDPIALADLFLKADAPGDALRVLENVPDGNAKLARVATAAQLLGQSIDAMRAARSVWESGPLTKQIFATITQPGRPKEVIERWRRSPSEPLYARAALGVVATEKPENRDMEIVRMIGDRFRQDPRIQYLAYTCLLEAGKIDMAAVHAVRLAGLSIEKEQSLSPER